MGSLGCFPWYLEGCYRSLIKTELVRRALTIRQSRFRHPLLGGTEVEERGRTR